MWLNVVKLDQRMILKYFFTLKWVSATQTHKIAIYPEKYQQLALAYRGEFLFDKIESAAPASFTPKNTKELMFFVKDSLVCVDPDLTKIKKCEGEPDPWRIVYLQKYDKYMIRYNVDIYSGPSVFKKCLAVDTPRNDRIILKDCNKKDLAQRFIFNDYVLKNTDLASESSEDSESSSSDSHDSSELSHDDEIHSSSSHNELNLFVRPGFCDDTQQMCDDLLKKQNKTACEHKAELSDSSDYDNFDEKSPEEIYRERNKNKKFKVSKPKHKNHKRPSNKRIRSKKSDGICFDSPFMKNYISNTISSSSSSNSSDMNTQILKKKFMQKPRDQHNDVRKEIQTTINKKLENMRQKSKNKEIKQLSNGKLSSLGDYLPKGTNAENFLTECDVNYDNCNLKLSNIRDMVRKACYISDDQLCRSQTPISCDLNSSSMNPSTFLGYKLPKVADIVVNVLKRHIPEFSRNSFGSNKTTKQPFNQFGEGLICNPLNILNSSLKNSECAFSQNAYSMITNALSVSQNPCLPECQIDKRRTNIYNSKKKKKSGKKRPKRKKEKTRPKFNIRDYVTADVLFPKPSVNQEAIRNDIQKLLMKQKRTPTLKDVKELINQELGARNLLKQTPDNKTTDSQEQNPTVGTLKEIQNELRVSALPPPKSKDIIPSLKTQDNLTYENMQSSDSDVREATQLSHKIPDDLRNGVIQFRDKKNKPTLIRVKSEISLPSICNDPMHMENISKANSSLDKYIRKNKLPKNTEKCVVVRRKDRDYYLAPKKHIVYQIDPRYAKTYYKNGMRFNTANDIFAYENDPNVTYHLDVKDN